MREKSYCGKCSYCISYFTTKRKYSCSGKCYRCEHPDAPKTGERKNEITRCRGKITDKIKQAPRWCPLNKNKNSE